MSDPIAELRDMLDTHSFGPMEAEVISAVLAKIQQLLNPATNPQLRERDSIIVDQAEEIKRLERSFDMTVEARNADVERLRAELAEHTPELITFSLALNLETYLNQGNYPMDPKGRQLAEEALALYKNLRRPNDLPSKPKEDPNE